MIFKEKNIFLCFGFFLEKVFSQIRGNFGHCEIAFKLQSPATKKHVEKTGGSYLLDSEKLGNIIDQGNTVLKLAVTV